MKHMIIGDYISTFPTNDALEGFIELTDEQETICGSLWAQGFVITTAFDVITDVAAISEANAFIVEEFATSKYAAQKLKSMRTNEAVAAQMLEDTIGKLKDSNKVNKETLEKP